MNSTIKSIGAGFIFAILWGSASTSTKIALLSAQPFTISICRFIVAAAILLFFAHAVYRQPLPRRSDWKKLMIYGLLNIAVYLGFFIIGMQFVSAGIASLFIATNPVFIAVMAAVWLKYRVRLYTVVSLLICSLGILVAAYPLLETSYVTPLGLIIIMLSMISYSVASLYFSTRSWKGLHILTINGWQTLFGALFTMPLFLVFYEQDKNTFTLSLAASVLWLAVPVSIAAVQLWLYLLKENPVKASFWLFLCPISGILIAAWALNEPLSMFTVAGVALVIAGLYIVQRYRKPEIKTAKVAPGQASPLTED